MHTATVAATPPLKRAAVRAAGLWGYTPLQLAALASSACMAPTLLFRHFKSMSRLSMLGFSSSVLVVAVMLSLLPLDPHREHMPQQVSTQGLPASVHACSLERLLCWYACTQAVKRFARHAHRLETDSSAWLPHASSGCKFCLCHNLTTRRPCPPLLPVPAATSRAHLLLTWGATIHGNLCGVGFWPLHTTLHARLHAHALQLPTCAQHSLCYHAGRLCGPGICRVGERLVQGRDGRHWQACWMGAEVASAVAWVGWGPEQLL